VIDCDEDGSVSPTALSQMLDERVRLVALTWLPANGGLVNPATAIGRLCRAANVPFFIDAGQALGQVVTDVQALGCDVLVGAGRKHLRGPRGTGILYVRRKFLPTLQPAFLDVLSAPWEVDGPVLRDDARLFEKGEASLALLLGLGVAVRDTRTLGVPAIQARIGELANSLRAQLPLVPGVQMLDLGRTHSGIVSFNVTGHDAVEVRQRLSAQGINVAANLRGYTPLDMTARGLASVVRASLSYLNTEAEVTRLVEAIDELASR
jgi:selenocysteine lyase/cysteine desulfurase